MPIDFGRLSKGKPSKRAVDPIELFQSLKVADRAVNDLWLAQGDALRTWHSNRSKSDVAISLNTGAGKTLVGLLAAQSLANETNGQVLYACSSIQLIEQTANKAEGYGLEVATYFQREFSNDLYHLGQSPCITTYQALFNGKSRFFRDDVSAVVFDDAHTADHLLRDAFTLKIERENHPDLYGALAHLFRVYFARIGAGVGYVETIERRDPSGLWFVPPFVVQDQLNELQRILLSGNLSEHRTAKYAWEHIKDRIDLCCTIVSGNDVSFTPPVIPTLNLPYFRDGVRRLYLSATLARQDGFVRTFGLAPDVTVAPATTAGECERLILIPSLQGDCRDDRQVAKQMVLKHKALVLTPSYRASQAWNDVTPAKEDETVTDQVENFKRASAPSKLVLVGRYDGVDLPGDTCRVMVIDGLPSGLGALERFLWERLGLGKTLRSTIASRVVQSFGRISRGMSDHGVVILVGEALREWLLSAKNRAALPRFLRTQLELGLQISRNTPNLDDMTGAPEQCLSRDEGWIKYYIDAMETASQDSVPEDSDAVDMARVESKFGHALWAREYETAARTLQRSLDSTFKLSRNTGAWHALWLGYAYELSGAREEAVTLYKQAHSILKNIPPYVERSNTDRAGTFPSQVLEVSEFVGSTESVRTEIMRRFDLGTATLNGADSSRQVEEALRVLGEYLGLRASRPDNEFGTGPDVLWEVPSGPALSFEVKSGKAEAISSYRKRDLGQLRDHRRWVVDNSTPSDIISVFVGPRVPATPDANPDPDILVIELGEFRELAERLRAALVDIGERSIPTNVAEVTWEVLRTRNLLWPSFFDAFSKIFLKELSGR